MSGAGIRCCPVCGSPRLVVDTRRDDEHQRETYRDEYCPDCFMYRYLFRGPSGFWVVGEPASGESVEALGFCLVRLRRGSDHATVEAHYDKRDRALDEARAMHRDPFCHPFVAAIKAAVRDQAPRLVFADFLDENNLYPLQSEGLKAMYEPNDLNI